MQAVGHCLRAVMTMIQVRVTGATARRRITETGTISTWVIIMTHDDLRSYFLSLRPSLGQGFGDTSDWEIDQATERGSPPRP